MTERDYEMERQRGLDIEQEIEEAFEKAWGGEPPPDGEWRKQTDMTNELLVRVVVLLEGIRDELQTKQDDEKRWDPRRPGKREGEL